MLKQFLLGFWLKQSLSVIIVIFFVVEISGVAHVAVDDALVEIEVLLDEGNERRYKLWTLQLVL